MRCAGYVRVSSEDQVAGFSIDAQITAIKGWIRAHEGLLAGIYVDEGESGRTSNRPAFQQMRRAAYKRKFDALVVHRFDRFARNRADALAMKSLLRDTYGIKLFSVTEPSEDSDGPFGALIEGVMETVADWYSQNLAAEVAKGKKERARQGLHNNRPPFGLSKDNVKVLVPDADLPGLLLAFERYSTAGYSDRDVAQILHEAGYLSKSGRPFSAETVRSILQNRTYLGEVKYQKYVRRPDGSRSYEGEIQWFKGQHEPVIGEELFERCQQVRRERAAHCQATERYNPYLLRNLAYCWRCSISPPEATTIKSFGKMRCHAQSRGKYRYYRCRATSLGYSCKQKGVRTDVVDRQVVDLLKQLEPPVDWQERAVQVMGRMLGYLNLQERLAELRTTIQRMDLRWDKGFISDERDYIEQRMKLERELDRLTPIPREELRAAVDAINHFPEHWEELEHEPEERHRKLTGIVERVYIKDDQVVAIVLRRNFGAVLGNDGLVSVSGNLGARDRETLLNLS